MMIQILLSVAMMEETVAKTLNLLGMASAMMRQTMLSAIMMVENVVVQIFLVSIIALRENPCYVIYLYENSTLYNEPYAKFILLTIKYVKFS